jgi:hypothetical protein
MSPYQVMAGLVLAGHLAWILWVILGAFLTRGQPRLAWFHVASLVYGIVIEAAPWPCPLTLLENWLEARAGITPYTGGFLVHYLDALVYPDVSLVVLVWCAVGVAAINLGIYGKRAWAR